MLLCIGRYFGIIAIVMGVANVGLADQISIVDQRDRTVTLTGEAKGWSRSPFRQHPCSWR